MAYALICITNIVHNWGDPCGLRDAAQEKKNWTNFGTFPKGGGGHVTIQSKRSTFFIGVCLNLQ